MKYGETAFDLFYLIFAVISGCRILRKAKTRTGTWMGQATLILGCGDAFHLVPRVLNYFSTADLTAALGIGKLITSLTMTAFYVYMYKIWAGVYRVKEEKNMTCAVFVLAAVRILLCLFPQNGWRQNSSDVTWGILRNVPFVLLGALVIVLFYRNRVQNSRFRHFWLLILLSFLFYIPVAVGAGIVPMLGMLMLPKTVCYILMIVVFLGSVFKDGQ